MGSLEDSPSSSTQLKEKIIKQSNSTFQNVLKSQKNPDDKRKCNQCSSGCRLFFLDIWFTFLLLWFATVWSLLLRIWTNTQRKLSCSHTRGIPWLSHYPKTNPFWAQFGSNMNDSKFEVDVPKFGVGGGSISQKFGVGGGSMSQSSA